MSRGDITPDAARGFYERFLERTRRGEALCLLARAGRRSVGFGEVVHLSHPSLPEGWYLSGLVVAPDWRRRGIGDRLTKERLDWIAARAPRAYYFANSRNGATIDLHARFGFREIQRGLAGHGLTFAGGVGLLFALDFPASG